MTSLPLKKQAERVASVKYFTVMQGQDKAVFWITEVYHLYNQPTDSDSDRYFIKLEQEKFDKHDDTFIGRFEGIEYHINFMCDLEQETKMKVMIGLHHRRIVKIKLDE